MDSKELMTIGTNSDEDMRIKQLKAAYALNMCTVSVSQIVQYNDIYVLEQEYDAILNNLNLEEMPKDEALLTILTEILNTITYFRIHEIRKAQIEKKYKRQMKNAIWSSVSNMNFVVSSGNPYALAASLAIQVGIGYMNYRRKKAEIGEKREDEEIELEITAIEQLNALKRELFTTAWRLADKYGFPDEYRLTENQIRQYNEILMDTNDVRKYERLEAISDKFKAFPPFWYHIGHTAAYIAETRRERSLKEYYTDRAKEHFQQFRRLYSDNKLNLLREDQMTAAYALEYADLLLRENVDCKELLDIARKNAGNSNDILQLCAMGYLKCGAADDAARLFRILVNESYNTETNAQLLSRIYVAQALEDRNNREARINYNVLKERVGAANLFPMPKPNTLVDSAKLNEEYLEKQKKLLKEEYKSAYNSLIEKYVSKINRLILPESVFGSREDSFYSASFDSERRAEVRRVLDRSSTNRYEYISLLKTVSLRTVYVDILNEMLSEVSALSVFGRNQAELIKAFEEQIGADVREPVKEVLDKLAKNEFTLRDYDVLCEAFSFETASTQFFELLRKYTRNAIEKAENRKELNDLEAELLGFCDSAGIEFRPAADHAVKTENRLSEGLLRYEVMGDDVFIETGEKKVRQRMLDAVTEIQSRLLTHSGKGTEIKLYGSESFYNYFKNAALNSKARRIMSKTVAIIDDKSARDSDLLLTIDGIRFVDKNKHSGKNLPYGMIKLLVTKGNGSLSFGRMKTYTNPDVNIDELWKLIERFKEIIRQSEQDEN